MTARRCDALPWNTTAAGLIGCVLVFLGLALAAAAIDASHDGAVSEVLTPIGCTCDD